MNATTQNQRYALQELEKEALIGAEGEETFAREVRCIDLSNFAARKNDIAEQLWEAAVEFGCHVMPLYYRPYELAYIISAAGKMFMSQASPVRRHKLHTQSDI